jgi:signal peptidase II
MKLDELLKKNFFNFLFVLFIFLLDQISKYLVIEHFNQSLNQTYVVNSFLSFNLIWNDGIAFGLLRSNNQLFYNLITILILVILIFIIRLSLKARGLEKISYFMILGGGLGNIFDRYYHGSVIDFIDLNYKNFHWFIFNIADIFISIGIIILIFTEIKKND